MTTTRINDYGTRRKKRKLDMNEENIDAVNIGGVDTKHDRC